MYAFWGRFYEAIPLDMNIRAINGERYVIMQHVSNVPLEFEQLVQPERQPAGEERAVDGAQHVVGLPRSRRSTKI